MAETFKAEGESAFRLTPEAGESFRPIIIHRNPRGELVLCFFSGQLARNECHGALTDRAKVR